MHKEDIKNFSLEELKKQIVAIGSRPYRATQLFFWIYQKGIADFSGMRNLPQTLRDRISENYYISTIELAGRLKSRDRTEKFLFKLSDGSFIETVLIYAENRKTACISTQVGCKFGCLFCASGSAGFVRNLAVSEIINQILFLRHKAGVLITNYVFMGMGEPLDNYENVIKALKIMNEPHGLNIGARRITVSTCGIIPGIEKLGDLDLQVNLSISLHATNDRLRNELVPINRRYPIDRLIKSCENYIKKTKRALTLEYVLIRGKNDTPNEADELAKIARDLKAKVNLIPCSPNLYSNFNPPGGAAVNIFIKRLVANGINATLRLSKGKDIQAACGQLAGRLKKQKI